MAERQRVSSGSPFEPTIGFSRAVRVGDRVVVSGTGPVVPGGTCPDDAAGQARRCFEIIEAALAEAGASLHDVVRTRMYITAREDADAVGAVHGELLGAVRPAATMVVVAELLDPAWKVEIEAEAVVPGRAGSDAGVVSPDHVDRTAVCALDPAERYFWLLGRIASVNGVLSAYVDRTFEEGELTAALRGLQRRHPLLRARVDVVDDELVFVEADGEIPLTVLPLAPGQPSHAARMELWPFEPAPHPLAACIYEPVEGEERSVVTLNVHHVLVDGNMARTVLQQLMRMIDAGATDFPLADVVPDPLHSRFPEALLAPRAAVEVLREVRAERDGQLPASEFPFHDRLAPGLRPRNDLLCLGGDALAAYLARAKALGASVTGAVGADILRAGAALFDADEPEPRMLNFASAVDLRSRVEPPLPNDAAMVAIGMLCTPYLVSDETRDTLARTIGDQIAREVARGESHLFYRFARVASFPPTDAGEAAFAKWVDSAPQNITVSSLGRIDDTGDPPWLRRLATIMPANPNQVSFIATLTYRGEMTLSIATDSTKLPPEVADRFVAEIMARTGARLEATTTFDPAKAQVAG